MSSVSDKLKSLGVGKGPAHLSKPKPDSLSIDSVVAGAFHSTPRGEVFYHNAMGVLKIL